MKRWRRLKHRLRNALRGWRMPEVVSREQFNDDFLFAQNMRVATVHVAVSKELLAADPRSARLWMSADAHKRMWMLLTEVVDGA